jgi:hypothetical protein
MRFDSAARRCNARRREPAGVVYGNQYGSNGIMARMVAVGDVVLRDRTNEAVALARVVKVVGGEAGFEEIALFRTRALAEAAARELCDQGRVVWAEASGPLYVRFVP